MTDFMKQLERDISDKGGRNGSQVSPSSAKLYIKSLRTLNGKKDFDNLKFLDDIGAVLEIMNKYSLNYKKSLINAVLSVMKVRKLDEDVKANYLRMFETTTEELDKIPKNKLNEKQEQAYMSWDKVNEIKQDLYKKINKRETKLNKLNDVIDYFILSLYTDIPPRRNADYTNMVIVKEHDERMGKDLNYLDLAKKEMIFNIYKTAKTYGEQRIKFGDNKEFSNALRLYLRQRGIKNLKKGEQLPLLITMRGTAITSGVQLKRTLNRILNANVGATMLRHIYLTSKYGKVYEEMKEDAMDMGHSLTEQKEYIVDGK